MKISIIIPVYNVEPYIEKCLRSVMNQTFQGELECIVVDDCGSDESMVIVERVISNYDGPVNFNVLHHERNLGLSAARNTGMAVATGDYLFFLDSDDTLSHDCIIKLAEPLRTRSFDFIVGDIEYVDENGNPLSFSMRLKFADNCIIEGEDILNTYLSSWYVLAQNKLYRADFLKRNQLSFKEGIIHEDLLWGYQIACMAKSVYVVTNTTYYYLRRYDGIMGSEKKTKNRSYIEIVKEMTRFLTKWQINRKRAVLLFYGYFARTLSDYVADFSQYRLAYTEMRSEFQINTLGVVKSIGIDLKWYYRDFHFVLPLLIAPYWMWITYSLPMSFIKIIKKEYGKIV